MVGRGRHLQKESPVLQTSGNSTLFSYVVRSWLHEL